MSRWWRRSDRDFDREIRAHLELEAEALVGEGMDPAEARRVAHQRFGNVTTHRERYYESQRARWLNDLVGDLRLAARLLRKQWRFSALVVLVLALGTGANTALFSVANGLLFKPLPVRQPEHLVWVYGGETANLPYAVYRDYAESLSTLEGLAGFGVRPLSLRIDGTPRIASGQVVTGNYFDVLGVSPWRGRLFEAGDEVVTGSSEVAVISHGLWERRFGADESVVGQTVEVNGRTFAVVGVAPPGFQGTLRPLGSDLWIPIATTGVDPPSLHALGRMVGGVTVAEVTAEVDTLRGRFSETFPDRHFFSAVSVYSADGSPPILSGASSFIFPLLGLTILALLVACFNVASLMLARSSERRDEMSLRMALGASRARLARQLLTESALLTLLGTVAGVALAQWASGALVTIDLPVPELAAVTLDVALDSRVLLFSSGLATLAVLTFGVTPMLRATGASTGPTFRREVSSLSAPRTTRTRAVLVSAQLALSVVVLTATGLLLQSWRHAVDTDLGFDPDPVMAVGVNPAAMGYDTDRRRVFYRQLVEQLPRLQQVSAASAVEIVPLTLSSRTALMLRPGEPVPSLSELIGTAPRSNNITPGYFETVGIPFLAGRDFSPADDETAPSVTIVDEALADRLWPGESPIGRRLRRLSGPPPYTETDLEVIGVVGNAKYATVGEAPGAFAYFPLLQSDPDDVTILVRGRGAPAATLPAVHDMLARVDAHVPVVGEAGLSDMTTLSLLPLSAAGLIMGGIGALTMLLAVLGVAGVLLHLVRQRTGEIGVRVALGASRPTVAALVLGESGRWLLVGLGIGAVASLVLGRFVSSFLYGVSPTEPLVLVGAMVLLTTATGLASLVPARRAWRVDPMTALRME